MRAGSRNRASGTVRWGVILFFALAVTAWAIWSFSLESGAESARRSNAAYRLVESAVNRFAILRNAFDAANITDDMLHENFRKIAHFVEYAVLGFLAQAFFAALRRMNGHYAVHGLSIGLAAAVIDELLQSTLRDRGPMVRDVALDFAGVLFGSIIMWLLFGLWRLARRVFAR
ncbi:MAG: VanZ family protein [Oscillospiraceae bacterium]|nr:VanZ family protein [Oscillospiraceae bacterium]